MIIIEAPIAIRGIQTAERDVLRAAYSAEVADRRRAISAQFAALLSAAEQLIDALTALHPDEMSPRDALEALYALKGKLPKQ